MEETTTLYMQDYLKILKKRAIPIIIITLLTTIIASLISIYIISPVYMAETSILVGTGANQENNRLVYEDILTYQELMKTFGEIAKSTLVSTKSAELMDNAITSDIIQKSISIGPQMDTQILVISARNRDPEKARIISETVTNCFITEVSKIFPEGNFIVIDKAQTPIDPARPTKIINTLLGFLFGFSLSIVFVFLMEHLDKTIKGKDDLQRCFEYPILGIIPIEK